MRRIFGGPSAPDPRFIAGTVAEIEELFGGRVPELPDGPLDPATGDLFLVDLFPPLRKCLRDLVEYLYRGLTATADCQTAGTASGQEGTNPTRNSHIMARSQRRQRS